MTVASDQSSLVLLHGILMSGNAWQRVVPLLSHQKRVYPLTTAGHHGGSPAPRRPHRISDLVDDIERQLDELGLDRPHIAGHSLGGWMAIELARRGRAATICALAPGGFWSAGDATQNHVHKQIRKLVAMNRLAEPIRPAVALVMKSPALRRISWRDAACHADRLTPAQGMEILDDAVGCTINETDLLGSDQQLAPLNPLPCPVTIAWAANDAIIPVPACDAIAHDRLPPATFTTLPDCGHVPMIDNPELVASTVLAAVNAE